MAQLPRTINFIASKIKISNVTKKALPILYYKRALHTTNYSRSYRHNKYYAPMLFEFNRRMKELKFKETHPDELYPARPKRSLYSDWNYDVELYTVGKRFNEEFRDDLLREALIDSSYILQETQKLKKAGITDPKLNLKSNDELASAGKVLIEDFNKQFLRGTRPLLPEEAIECVSDYLSSTEVLSNICEQLGFTDLILTKEYPPSRETYAKSFAALIGCLNASSGLERCQLFIKDFITTQLVGKQLWDIWEVEDPLHMLKDILHRTGRGEADPRLIGELGRNTIESVYHIGIYDGYKDMVGKGFGETVNIGVKVAAYDSLGRLFGSTIASAPLPFQDKNVNRWLKAEPNPSLNQWTGNGNTEF